MRSFRLHSNMFSTTSNTGLVCGRPITCDLPSSRSRLVRWNSSSGSTVWHFIRESRPFVHGAKFENHRQTIVLSLVSIPPRCSTAGLPAISPRRALHPYLLFCQLLSALHRSRCTYRRGQVHPGGSDTWLAFRPPTRFRLRFKPILFPFSLTL